MALAGALSFMDRDIPLPWSPLEAPRSATGSDDASLKQFQSALATEVQARRDLAARLEELEAKVSDLALTRTNITASSSLAEIEKSVDDRFDSDKSGLTGPGATRETGSSTSRFDDEALLALGVHPRDVDRLHDRWISQELATAALSNQALREGWFQQRRHRTERIKLEMTLRQELRDEDYDRYLYALGKTNRLEAGEVLTGSLASDAGLRQGDVILSYDDVRLFRPSDLLVASSRGESGRSVPIEVLRGGRRQTLYVRRGPLGAIIKNIRAEPLED